MVAKARLYQQRRTICTGSRQARLWSSPGSLPTQEHTQLLWSSHASQSSPDFLVERVLERSCVHGFLGAFTQVPVMRIHVDTFRELAAWRFETRMSKFLPVLGRRRYIPRVSRIEVRDQECRSLPWAVVSIDTPRELAALRFETRMSKSCLFSPRHRFPSRVGHNSLVRMGLQPGFAEHG